MAKATKRNAPKRKAAKGNAPRRQAALEQIREHIARSGHHIYVVRGETMPRFAYTIGVSESMGVEFILAGAIFYMKDEIVKIINDIVPQFKEQRDRKVF